MEIRDLYVSQLRKLVPLKVEETNLDDITDSRLGEWATEICADVFNKEGDKSYSGEHTPITKGDGKNN